MGLFDSLLPKYKPSPTSVEGALGPWTASRTFGGFAVAGGQVLITKEHLVFTPWDMDQTRKWLFKALALAGAPSYVGKIDMLLSKTKLLEPVAIPLAAIVRVETLNRASLLKPPTARLHLQDGRAFDVAILASPRTPNFSDANNQAFQDWLSHMPLTLRT